ncbi:hypothetical protein V2J09_022867 [Rumex salicifolius]
MDTEAYGKGTMGYETRLEAPAREGKSSNLPETYSVPIFFQGDDIKNLQYVPILHQCFSDLSGLKSLSKEKIDEV